MLPRPQIRELAEGDRIVINAAERENRVRSGDFATVEEIGVENSISARLDSGRVIELNPDKARHIDHGYTVERAQHLSADRILLIKESSHLVGKLTALTNVNSHTREIAIYTSDRATPLQNEQGLATRFNLSPEGFSGGPIPHSMPEPALPEIDFVGFGLNS